MLLRNLRLRWLLLWMKIKPPLIALTVLVATSEAAGAQVPIAPSNPPSSTANPAPAGAANCAPTQSTPQGKIAPMGKTSDQVREPLGDTLAKSDGVLCPPANVDPAIRAPTPDVGTMPVIPPPGSPGGDPTIRPK
jgi:hypothetical protein